MDIWIKAAQLLTSLSILIILHELGHFIPALLFKTRVEKFYLFFDAGFSLFKFKKGDTEYGIGWLPLGGYVKIAGMIDESFDKEQLKEEPKPWEFRSKPTWQRLIIMIGGVVVNFILALFIYWMSIWVWGKEYLPIENVKYGIEVAHESIKSEDMFMDGDQILTVNGSKPKTLQEIGSLLLIDGYRDIEIFRNNEIVQVTLPADFDQIILRNKIKGALFEPRFPTVVAEVLDESEAKKSGLEEGDSIVSVDGTMVPYYYDFREVLSENKELKVDIGFYREQEFLSKTVLVSEEGTIGFKITMPDQFLDYTTEKFGFFASFPEGVGQGITTLSKYVKSMGLLFTKEGATAVGGFGSIGNIFPAEWDWQSFWLNTAFLSIILAFMNILPIPALDGGHVLFLIYEMISGKPPSDKFLLRAQVIGFAFVIALLLYANGLDIYRWITGG